MKIAEIKEMSTADLAERIGSELYTKQRKWSWKQ